MKWTLVPMPAAPEVHDRAGAARGRRPEVPRQGGDARQVEIGRLADAGLRAQPEREQVPRVPGIAGARGQPDQAVTRRASASPAR